MTLEYSGAVLRWYGMQSPLTLPEDATPTRVIHVNERVQLREEGEVRVVVVCGLPIQHYARLDAAAQAYAMASLAQEGLATATELAAAFGCVRLTVYRTVQRYQRGGLAAMLRGKSGPKGPSVLREVATRRMIVLKRKGVPNGKIATRLGVTEGAIRAALKRVGYTRSRPAASTASQVREGSGDPEVSPALGVAPPEETAAVRDPAVQGRNADPAVATLEADPVAQPLAVAASRPAAPVSAARADLDPLDRSLDRLLARMGLLEDAAPQFAPCARVPGAGVLLAVPALVQSGVFAAAQTVYGSLGPAFYGVRSVLLTLLLMALLRVRRAEGLRHLNPIILGRILGLDRAPEVKTIRGKVQALAAQGKSEVFLQELARQRIAAHSEAMGFLYVDGHVRVYHGKHALSKAHVTRLRLAMPATIDHWVCDVTGTPVFVVTATPSLSLVRELPPVLRKVRALVGSRRVTVAFDRGGWSPKLFAQLITEGFDVLTYRKGKVPRVRRDRFTEHAAVLDGREVRYELAERTVRLLKGTLTMREVVRLGTDGKHQTSIVTSRTDLPAIEVAYRMFERWQQENFFKYMAEEYALDALVEHGVELADQERLVPNPARRAIEKKIALARANVQKLERAYGAAAAANPESQRPTMRGFKIAHGAVGQALRQAREAVDRLCAKRGELSVKVPAGEASRDGQAVRLRTESKRLTDALKMVAYQAETALFRLVGTHYKRSEDEGRKLLVGAFKSSADLSILGEELHVRLEPAASPNRTKAIAKLCDELNATRTLFPGSTLRLSFSIREG